MELPSLKTLEYKIKAPGFRGAFFLRAHSLENEVDYHGSLELQPLGLKIFSATKRLEFTARSRCQKSFLQDLVSGKVQWTDGEVGQYEYFERDGVKNREYHYKLNKQQALSVSENGKSIRQIGISPGRKMAFLDVLQLFFLGVTILERTEIEGLLISGKLRKVFIEKVSSSEIIATWDEKKPKEVLMMLNERDKCIDSLSYKLPVFGQIFIERKSAEIDDDFKDVFE